MNGNGSNNNLKRIMEFVEIERARDIEACYWLSFVDDDLPKGECFLGVIVTMALGKIHAIMKTHNLGINPGGEVAVDEIVSDFIEPEHMDMLLDAQCLAENDYGKKVGDGRPN